MRSARRRTVLRLLATWALPAAVAVAPAAMASDGAWIGIRMSGESADGGVRIGGVIRDSPAAAAGLRARDVIVAFDGEPVSDPSQLVRAVQERGAGAWVPLTVRRGEDEVVTRVRLTARPERPEEAPVVRGWIGAEALDIPASLREHFGAPPDKGAIVYAVAPGSPAEAAGLRVGDVVYEIDGAPVVTAIALQFFVAGGGVGNPVELSVARDGVRFPLEAVVADEPDAPDGRAVPER
jgi:serine protease Do